MTRAAFRQADMERIFRAAKATGATTQVDLKTLVVTVIPAIHNDNSIDTGQSQGGKLPSGTLAPDGKENWDED